MDRRRARGAAVLFLVAAGVALLDQATKIWAERALADGPVEVIPGVVRLRYTTNTGGAFSLFTDAPWFFAIASLVVTVIIVAVAFRPRPVLSSVALGMILGGAVGNLTDRALRGPGLSGDVVDFVDLHVWPVFNLADSAIVVGAVLLAFVSMRTGPADRSAPSPVDGHGG